jgi:hypothetical protein
MLPLDEWFRVHQPKLGSEITMAVEEWVAPEHDPESLARMIKTSVRDAFLKATSHEQLKREEQYDADLEWAMTILTASRSQLVELSKMVLDDINKRRGYLEEGR